MICRKCGKQMKLKRFNNGEYYYVCEDCRLRSGPVEVDEDSYYRTEPPVEQTTRSTQQAQKKQKKKSSLPKIFFAAAVLLLFLAIGLSQCGGSGSSSSSTPENTQEVTTQEVTTTQEETTVAFTVSLSQAKDIVEIVMRDSFGEDNYSIEVNEEEGIINASVWGDGIAEGAVQAVTNDELYLSWVSMVSSLVDSALTTTESIQEMTGRDDIMYCLSLLNDENKENALLYVVNGVTLYDVVEQARASQ